jgi:murein L,D-transpeptidase YafK
LRRELDSARALAEQAAREASAEAASLRRLREPVGVAERVLVEKAARLLHLLRDGEKVRTYRIALGPQPIGPKSAKGDGRTPEGVYNVESRNARSRFFRALKLSHPDQTDRAQAAANGARPGGDIMIHGQPRGARGVAAGDWTDGCVAVSNPAMQEIWAAVPVGTLVEIRP